MKKTSNTIINIFLIFIVLGAVITAGIYGLRFFLGLERIKGKEEAQGRSGGPDICKKIIFRHTLNNE
ncbi:hypothetical protein ES705_26479 [subsurface metagenome]